MAIPKAVQKIGKAAELAADETGMKNKNKLIIDPAQVDEQIEPVKAEPAKIDPEDYKARYGKYKGATDKTIADLRKVLATTQASLTETQGQVQDLLLKANAVQSKTVVEEKSLVGTKDDPAFKAYWNKLPGSIKDEYTEDYLFDQYLIQTTASAGKDSRNTENEAIVSLQNKLDNVLQVQNKTAAEKYEDQLDVAYPDDKWIVLTNSGDWSDFCLKTVSAVDSRRFGDVVKRGSESHDATSVIWVLKEFEKHLKTLDEVENVTNDLSGMVTPAGSGASDSVSNVSAEVQSFTGSQVTQFFKDVAVTNKYTEEEAGIIQKNIIEAQAAGKIMPG